MDSGTLAIILTPISIILTALLTQYVVRRNAKENTEIGRFEANMDAAFKRADAAEARVALLETKDREKEERIRVLEEKDSARERQLARIRQVVQDWILVLKEEWATFSDKPMPMPPDEDLELLGITRPRNRRQR